MKSLMVWIKKLSTRSGLHNCVNPILKKEFKVTDGFINFVVIQVVIFIDYPIW
jgi:hypothetical protein